MIRQPCTGLYLARTWEQIPHVNCQEMVDITRLEEFRARHKAAIQKMLLLLGLRLLYMNVTLREWNFNFMLSKCFVNRHV